MPSKKSSTWDIEIKAGTTWDQTLRWTVPTLNPDGTIIRDVNGKPVYAPMDTTDWKAKMQIRDRLGGRLLLTLGTADVVGADGVIAMGGANGHIHFMLPFAKTEALKGFRNAVHDVELISPDDTQKLPWAEGTVQIKEQVTQ